MNTFVVLLAGLLPTYLIRFSVAGIPTNLFEVLVWVVFIINLSGTKTRRQLVNAIHSIPLSTLIWVCLFLLAAILSTAISPNLQSSLGILKGWIITPMVFGLLVYAARYNSPVIPAHEPGSTPTYRQAGRVVWIPGPHFAHKLRGAQQARNDGDFSILKHIVHSLTLSGFVVALLGLSQIHGLNRITSIYDVPNSLALFLVPVFVIAAWIGIREKNRFYQLISLVMLTAIIATQSFGALVAIAGTFLVAAVVPLPPIGGRVRVRATQYGLFFLFLVLALSALLFSGRFQYLISPLTNSNTTNSATVRLQLWDIGIRLIKKNPILGIGLGQFEPAYQGELHGLFAKQANEAKSYPPEGRTRRQLAGKLAHEFVFRDPHNWIISFWLNLGITGLIAFVYLNYSVIKNVFTVRTKFSQPAELAGGDAYQHAIALGFISILMFGLFDTIYWKNDLSALWWMLLANYYSPERDIYKFDFPSNLRS